MKTRLATFRWTGWWMWPWFIVILRRTVLEKLKPYFACRWPFQAGQNTGTNDRTSSPAIV